MSKVCLNEVCWDMEDLKSIQGCFVCGLTDGVNDFGHEFILLTFFDPTTNKNIQLEVGSDGSIFISDPYSQEVSS